MTTKNTLKHHNPSPQGNSSEPPATGYPDEEVVGMVEPEKIIISGFDLTEFGVSAGPDRSGHTTMGRFLTDEGTGRMERLICSSLPAQPPAIEERAAECNSNRKKATSVVVEVRSVRSLDADRIARDFREK